MIMSTELLTTAVDCFWLFFGGVLVFFMQTGFTMVEAGFTRSKNTGNIIMKNIVDFMFGSIIYWFIGYGLMYGEGNGFIGIPFGDMFMNGMAGAENMDYTALFFQTVFCATSATIVSGAMAERTNFKAYCIYSAAISLFIYPIAGHWVWGGGFLMEMGAVDFAGGTVVHVNAGVAALVMALMVGRRKDYRADRPITPHNIPFVFLGTALLWLGWFGFNAGSGLAADGLAANAFLVTHIATCMAAVTWAAIDWVVNKKCTTVGACTGAVAGLVAITPAAGSVDLVGALFIGLITSAVCFWMVAVVKPKFGYDDALDAFGVHGVGGIIGSVLTGVFATQFVTGEGGVQGALYGDWNQLWIQIAATVISMVFSAVMTFVLFKVVDKLVGIRVDKRVEEEGLDIYEHGESAYDL